MSTHWFMTYFFKHSKIFYVEFLVACARALTLHVPLAYASIHACKPNDHHQVVYEEDLALFDAILSPLRDPASKPQIVDVNFDEGCKDKSVEYVNLIIVSTNMYLFLSISILTMII